MEADLDSLIGEIIVDAYGEDERLWAFRQVLEDEVELPADAFVIGELSLGEDFDGVLIWGLIDNRPYLRCLHSYGLCLWRLGESKEAERIFERLLWLSPSDNLGARFLLEDVKAGKSWETEYGRESGE